MQSLFLNKSYKLGSQLFGKVLCLVLAFFLIIPVDAFSNKKIDSLLQIVASYVKPDTHRVNLLNQLGYEYWIVDANQSEIYGKEALDLALQLDHQEGIAFAQRVVGVAHWARGDFNFALDFLFKSLTNYQSLKDILGEANCLMNIGLVFNDQRNFDQAFQYFEDANLLFEQVGAKDRMAMTFSKIGTAYVEQRAFDKAHQYYEQALALHQSQNFLYGIAEVNSRLGMLFLEKGDLDESLLYLQRALEVSESYGDIDGVVRNYQSIGRLYLKKKDYSNAQKYLEAGLTQAEKIGLKKALKEIYSDLKDLSIAQNRLPSAITYFEQYIRISDSLFNEEKASQIAKLQTQNEIAQKEQLLKIKQQEISLLKQQKKLNQLVTFSLIGGLLTVLIIAYLIIKQQRLNINKKQDLLSKNQQLHNSQQKLAQAKLENAKLKERELKQELEYKNKELASYTINFIQKNKLIEELKTGINQIKGDSNKSISSQLNRLNRILDSSLNIDKDWEDFKLHFEQVHQGFFRNLKEICPGLSNSELKLSALIRLNLNIKETAAILGISPESVKTARYRLRKKLPIEHGENLLDFMMQLVPQVS